ncbi:MAG: hypothetical protein ACE15F_06205 [bacterium]
MHAAGTVQYDVHLPRENNIQADDPYPVPVSSLTDGRGLAVRCEPGQGVILYGRTIRSFWPVLVRVAAMARSRSGKFCFTLGALGPSGHVVAEQKNGFEFFVRGWRTRSLVYNLSEGDRLYYPGETAITPILQVVSTDPVDEVLLYVDGYEVLVMRPAQWWGFDVFRSVKSLPATLYLEASQSVTPTPPARPTPTVTPTPKPGVTGK